MRNKMIRVQREYARGAFWLVCRCFSTGGGVIDEMIGYARSNYRTNYDQAIDILKSGLGFQQTGIGAGRLQLAQAEIEADRNRWPEVSYLCRQAAAAASEAQPQSPAEALIMAEVELCATLVGTRAFLTQHKDAEALQMAQQGLEIARKSFTASGQEDKRWQGIVLSNSVAALTQHAACDMEGAAESFDAVMNLADHADQRSRAIESVPSRDILIAEALKQAAAFRLGQRRVAEAAPLAARAAQAAILAVEGIEPNTSPMQSPLIKMETLVDARLQEAQVCCEKLDWDDAESKLSDALSIAEELSSGTAAPHVRVAFVLLPLAWVYSRTGRVTLAEGLYREVMKILRLSTSDESSIRAAESAVHPSIASLASWRYAQLLNALPKRSTEAAAWQKLATDLYDDAPMRRVLEPATVFGEIENLQGKGESGSGFILDLMCRRALPRVQAIVVQAGGAPTR